LAGIAPVKVAEVLTVAVPLVALLYETPVTASYVAPVTLL